MLRRTTIYLLAGLTAIAAGMLASLAAAGLAAADPVFPPGLRIGLEPPPGLVVSKQFPGFEDPDRKVTITLLELPGPAFEELKKTFYAPPPPGTTVAKREMFMFKGGIGYLASAQATADGIAIHKWLLLASATNSTVGHIGAVVTVQVPDAALAAYSDSVIRAALATVAFRAPPLAELLKLLPFKFDELAGFRVMQVMPGGVILTDGPTDDINHQPYMVIEIGRGAPSEPNGRGRFARDLLASAPVRDLNVTLGETMRITGAPGVEIRAKAKGLDGSPVDLVQWVRFGTAGFLRVIGVAHTGEWDQLFPRFRAVRDGIEFR